MINWLTLEDVIARMFDAMLERVPQKRADFTVD